MSEENLSQEFDAQVWAKEWMRTTKENPSIPTDEGCMTGWFANAIMAGYDHAKNDGKIDALRSELKEAQEELAKLKTHYRVPTHGACCTCQVCGNDYDTCRCTLDEVADQLTEAQEEIERIVKLFESLTPGGSEFVGDASACYLFIKDRLHTVIEVVKERNELREENKRLLFTIGELVKDSEHIYKDWCPAYIEEHEILIQKVIDMTLKDAEYNPNEIGNNFEAVAILQSALNGGKNG